MGKNTKYSFRHREPPTPVIAKWDVPDAQERDRSKRHKPNSLVVTLLGDVAKRVSTKRNWWLSLKGLTQSYTPNHMPSFYYPQADASDNDP